MLFFLYKFPGCVIRFTYIERYILVMDWFFNIIKYSFISSNTSDHKFHFYYHQYIKAIIVFCAYIVYTIPIFYFLLFCILYIFKQYIVRFCFSILSDNIILLFHITLNIITDILSLKYTILLLAFLAFSLPCMTYIPLFLISCLLLDRFLCVIIILHFYNLDS